MTTLKLGVDPGDMELILTDGADFRADIINEVGGVDTNWPTGTSLTLSITGDAATYTWPATITGATASWSVDKADTALISARSKVRLIYVNGTTDRVLFSGVVSRRG
ncbi:LtfC-like domain-containing protein [Nocardioides kribbensis]|uniref:LtfC/p132/Gp6 beta-sandwich domain-containing protein n=1 Tax=Nocardioides kribbensis TaxID=305517 RepID=A0ABV1NYX4_9ACTN